MRSICDRQRPSAPGHAHVEARNGLATTQRDRTKRAQSEAPGASTASLGRSQHLLPTEMHRSSLWESRRNPVASHEVRAQRDHGSCMIVSPLLVLWNLGAAASQPTQENCLIMSPPWRVLQARPRGAPGTSAQRPHCSSRWPSNRHLHGGCSVLVCHRRKKPRRPPGITGRPQCVFRRIAAPHVRCDVYGGWRRPWKPPGYLVAAIFGGWRYWRDLGTPAGTPSILRHGNLIRQLANPNWNVFLDSQELLGEPSPRGTHSHRAHFCHG